VFWNAWAQALRICQNISIYFRVSEKSVVVGLKSTIQHAGATIPGLLSPQSQLNRTQVSMNTSETLPEYTKSTKRLSTHI